jgi:hypothetical protein
MRAQDWSRRLLATAAMIAVAATAGCKTFTERYIALEVWKYERCFGHLPPGFTPPGAAVAAAAAPRVCGQQQQACCETSAPTAGCNSCEGQGTVMEGGMPAGVAVPAGPGGSPGPATGSAVPTTAGITAGKPVVISDEVVIP